MQLFQQLLEQNSATTLPKSKGPWCQSRTTLMLNPRLWHWNVFSGLVGVPRSPPRCTSPCSKFSLCILQSSKHICVCLNIIVESLPSLSPLPTVLGSISFLIWVNRFIYSRNMYSLFTIHRQWCRHREYRVKQWEAKICELVSLSLQWG